jgi:N-acetylneuraminate synthase
MEFAPEQWAGLKSHAEEKGLVFLSSPFSINAVRLLESLGMVAWKIASGEITNLILLDHIVRTGRPVLLSSGMSGWAELDAAVDFVRSSGLSLAVMQCTTAYPCRAEQIGLNVLGEMRQRYGCPVGLSDHSATIYPSLAAVTLGAKVVEVHVTMSREMFGPDVAASVTTEGLRQLVEGVRAIATMRAHPIDKDAVASGFGEMRQRFGQSIVAARDLLEGTILAMEHLSCRKPATGISAGSVHRVLGRRLRRGVNAGEFLSPGDFEG